ncbi:AraC family transcriptional regulator [Piscinibacter gummiphilus]|uniref:AraC family transcriptional regulator n=1 Tax=Piscinibacter gummiphilus TaxID=946333 RepID=A0A1W6L5P9_9BURK|nr:AraC family transcriptional regulator [Piscinibacter gummiphilus]ARN19661.1 AraC family transcriptional regulator [Piscinibacter gummiphilus]ATU64329.1 AraC family transcriptional regulator [Piscinibacter gummiphilus]
MTATVQVIARESGALASDAHHLLGLQALFAEMADHGIEATALLQGTGLTPAQLDDVQARISPAQKVAIFRNTLRLSSATDVGLRAGSRQRLSDFGVLGYALVSSTNFGEAVDFGIRHIRLAGPVLEKRFRIDNGMAIFEGHDVMALGDVLPLATEFWFASILKLTSCVLEAPLPSRLLLLPYRRPAYAAAYERLFGCPVRFEQPVMEWHFDADVLQRPCPNANPITAGLCASFCERLLERLPEESELARHIRTACLNSRGTFPGAEEMAERLGLSVRTLHRRLADEGQGYQALVDEVRCSLAIEYLRDTAMPVEQIANRVGFSDASNFRKAFRKWTGQAPTAFREAPG